MDLSKLLNLSKATRAADAKDGASRSTPTRTLKRFTVDDFLWMYANHSTHTMAEAGLALQRPGPAIRARCLQLGIPLKYSDCKNSNNRKPGKQKILVSAV